MSEDAAPAEDGLSRRTPAHHADAHHGGHGAAAQVPNEPPPNWFLHALLPFLKLRRSAEEPFWQRCFVNRRRLKLGEAFILSGILWLTMVFMTLYLLFKISSTTFQLKMTSKEGRPMPMQKHPAVGNHYNYVLVGKDLVQILLMQHLCGNLMEPLVGMRDHHFSDLDAMRPTGVVHWIRRVFSCLTCRRHEVRWFSTFIADHLLLLFVGSLSLIYQVVVFALKVAPEYVTRYDELDLVVVSTHWLWYLARALLSSYLSVLIMGFLVLTLEDSVVPKVSKTREFTGTMVLNILLWASNFLTLLYDRQMYTSAWFSPQPSVRMLASSAMLFVTHSSIMMGAVLMGHSAHFKRCPDLTWRKFWSRGIPLFVLSLGFLALIGAKRWSHTNESCGAMAYDLLAAPWPYVWTAWTMLGGGWLLWLALTESGAAAHHGARSEEIGDEEDIMRVLDYDCFLVAVTVSMAVCWNVAKAFEMEAISAFVSEISYIGALVAPAGLAAFATVVWKRPPKIGSQRYLSLWFALFFTTTMFLEFQEKEDCEISSDTPGCCGYPWFPDYNGKEEKSIHCNKPLRCKLHPNCSVAEHEEHGEAALREMWAQDSNGTWRGALAGRRLHEGPVPRFDQEECHELHDRWLTYSTTWTGGWMQAMQDAAAEAEEESTAFRLFVTIGQAASIEVYFTIFGVLLKVIFLTQHPNSEQILSLETHHHSEVEGENVVVTTRAAAAARGWRSIRVASRSGLLRQSTHPGPASFPGGLGHAQNDAGDASDAPGTLNSWATACSAGAVTSESSSPSVQLTSSPSSQRDVQPRASRSVSWAPE